VIHATFHWSALKGSWVCQSFCDAVRIDVDSSNTGAVDSSTGHPLIEFLPVSRLVSRRFSPSVSGSITCLVLAVQAIN
jgi:hypothetical protein